MQNTGRNELCPCGSGKKYKYCFLKHKPIQADKEFVAILPNENDLNLSDAEIETISKESFGDEKAIQHLANVTVFNAVGLIKEFDQHGPGFASFRVGDISCLMFYDPIRPLGIDNLSEIGKKLALENSKHYPAKIKELLEPND